MQTLESKMLESLVGGSSPGSCFAFGLGLTALAFTWYTPAGYFAAELAVVGAVGCFG